MYGQSKETEGDVLAVELLAGDECPSSLLLIVITTLKKDADIRLEYSERQNFLRLINRLTE
jgi:hypothetical protein